MIGVGRGVGGSSVAVGSVWRRRFGRTSGTSQIVILNTFNALSVCLKQVYGN